MFVAGNGHILCIRTASATGIYVGDFGLPQWVRMSEVIFHWHLSHSMFTSFCHVNPPFRTVILSSYKIVATDLNWIHKWGYIVVTYMYRTVN